MLIFVNNVNFIYRDNDDGGQELESVRVYFHGRSDDRTVNVNGHINISFEVYNANSDMESLTGLIIQHIKDNLDG